MPHMIGKHVMLREYRQEDFEHIRKWVNDRKTTEYLSAIFWFPQTEADTTDFLNRAMRAAPNASYFVIADVKDQSYIGQMDIFEINWKIRKGIVGTVIGSDGARGKGYGTEALKLLEDYAFGVLGLERLELDVYASNARAIRCYEKAGFRHEGTRRHAAMVNGKYTDVRMMAVIKEDWETKQA
ncbi:MAG: GNAT family N-acetyltransferase [Clostridiales bacterium]|nr:GNAT family N-acetyltransferase [Clostridiales bacterium]